MVYSVYKTNNICYLYICIWYMVRKTTHRFIDGTNMVHWIPWRQELFTDPESCWDQIFQWEDHRYLHIGVFHKWGYPKIDGIYIYGDTQYKYTYIHITYIYTVYTVYIYISYIYICMWYIIYIYIFVNYISESGWASQTSGHVSMTPKSPSLVMIGVMFSRFFWLKPSWLKLTNRIWTMSGLCRGLEGTGHLWRHSPVKCLGGFNGYNVYNPHPTIHLK